MNAVELETNRLILVPLSTNHLSQDYLSWLNDPEVNRYMEVNGNYTFDLLKSFLEDQEKRNILFWAIHLKDSNKHIGNIKIDPITNNSGEYGIMIGDKNSWGKGFAKEASLRVINYCFEEINLDEVSLGVVEDNSAAVTLYKKMGFKISEIRHNTGKYNGKTCNSIRMYLKNENV